MQRKGQVVTITRKGWAVLVASEKRVAALVAARPGRKAGKGASHGHR